MNTDHPSSRTDQPFSGTPDPCEGVCDPSSGSFLVKFEPDGMHVQVAAGVTILEAAEHAGIVLNAACGGQGTCRKCLVELVLTGEKVLACQTWIHGDLIVAVPEESRFFEQQILEEGIVSQVLAEPAVSKVYVTVPPPSLDDLRSDAARLIEAVQQAQAQAAGGETPDAEVTGVGLGALRQLPAALRDESQAAQEQGFTVTAVCRGGRVIAVEPGDTTGRLYGVAVDVGTTTVVASLVDLHTGRVVVTASATNPQVAYGDDVIARIHYSEQGEGLRVLHEKLVGCVNELIAELCMEANVAATEVYELTAAGNATMEHLLLGLPAGQIARAPYVGGFSSAVAAGAGELGIAIHAAGEVYVLPCVAGHVGGDTVAVALATGMRHSAGVALAIDIGTNGEMVISDGKRLAACSTAAGPAFEGARIGQGMRGAPGAIERIYLEDNDLRVEVIGGGPAAGICGSGLIDAVAALLDAGLVDVTGRLMGVEDAGEVPARLRERLTQVEGQKAVILARAEESRHGGAVLLTQRDIREMQLGKGAIYAGASALMGEWGIGWKELDRVYLAGAFGNYIRPESARRVGLLGPIPLERIQPVGNAAGAGAREVLVSRTARRLGERLAGEMEYIELAGRRGFQELFGESMLFSAE